MAREVKKKVVPSYSPRGIKKCPHCGCDKKFVRVDQYDAVACRNCLQWCESGCSQKDCEFCSNRPPTPNGVDWDDKNNTVY